MVELLTFSYRAIKGIPMYRLDERLSGRLSHGTWWRKDGYLRQSVIKPPPSTHAQPRN